MESTLDKFALIAAAARDGVAVTERQIRLWDEEDLIHPCERVPTPGKKGPGLNHYPASAATAVRWLGRYRSAHSREAARMWLWLEGCEYIKIDPHAILAQALTRFWCDVREQLPDTASYDEDERLNAIDEYLRARHPNASEEETTFLMTAFSQLLGRPEDNPLDELDQVPNKRPETTRDPDSPGIRSHAQIMSAHVAQMAGLPEAVGLGLLHLGGDANLYRLLSWAVIPQVADNNSSLHAVPVFWRNMMHVLDAFASRDTACEAFVNQVRSWVYKQEPTLLVLSLLCMRGVFPSSFLERDLRQVIWRKVAGKRTTVRAITP